MLEQAPVEQQIIKQCFRDGAPLPKRIANAPQLQLGLGLYHEAFWELDSCRPVGWGVGPIPWSAMHDYAQAFEFDDVQMEALFYYVRVMDQVYLKFQNKKPTGGGDTKWQPQGALGNSPNVWPSKEKP